MARGVILDLGGVVVSSAEPELYRIGAGRFGVSTAQLKAAVELHTPDLQTGRVDHGRFWQRVAEELNRSELAPEIPDWEMELYRRLVQVDPAMLDMARELRQRTRLGCLTNTCEPHAEVNRERGLFDWFDPCLLSHRLGLRKPDSEIYRLCLDRMGLPARDILFVDDQEENLVVPELLGMRTHLFQDRSGFRECCGKLGLLEYNGSRW